MGEAALHGVTAVAATGSQDPEVGPTAVAALRGLVGVLEARQVEGQRAAARVVAELAGVRR